MPALSTGLLFGGLALCTPAVNVPAGGAVYCHAVGQTPAAEQLNLVFAFDLATVQGKQQNITQTGFGRGCAPGVCAPGWYAEDEAIAFDTAAGPGRYCEVVIDPADTALTVDFEVHVDGQVVYQANEQALGTCPPKHDPGHATGRP